MASIFGYIRTSRRLQEGVPGMDPASQELQLRRAGVALNKNTQRLALLFGLGNLLTAEGRLRA